MLFDNKDRGLDGEERTSRENEPTCWPRPSSSLWPGQVVKWKYSVLAVPSEPMRCRMRRDVRPTTSHRRKWHSKSRNCRYHVGVVAIDRLSLLIAAVEKCERIGIGRPVPMGSMMDGFGLWYRLWLAGWVPGYQFEPERLTSICDLLGLSPGLLWLYRAFLFASREHVIKDTTGVVIRFVMLEHEGLSKLPWVASCTLVEVHNWRNFCILVPRFKNNDVR